MRTLPQAAVRPARVQAFVLRSPIATPVRTSFGIMRDRPAVFVRVEDADGAWGWGEVWCNFPSCGAEHRAQLVDTVLAPLLTSRSFASCPEAFEWLTAQTAVLAIQAGEYGPLAQAIAGLDLALWDLCARRSRQPLWRFLGGSGDAVSVYASGINPDQPQVIAAQRHADGYRAFKLKVGFGRERDLANLDALRQVLGDATPLMADANQAWQLEEALEMGAALRDFRLGWLEEPLRADRPWHEWQALKQQCATPLAAGENIVGQPAFEEALHSRVLAVLQPDLAKWGGISGCWPVVQLALQAGVRYCPHYLGGGVGLLASAHMLAACNTPGWLEVDANPNPLRTQVAAQFTSPDDGVCRLGDAPGIGREPDIAGLA
ncbi:MAG: mandelate racemase/muconate lactonizing enzyme family protein [Burkholderiales bacterium]|nr:mandelate racemase/muconate lactonizing enzyme family protein [Burkholderiales bacterium]